MPERDLPEHDFYVGGWERVTGRLGDNAQLGIYSPRDVTPSPAECPPDPLSKSQPLPARNPLDLSVLFLIQEDL